ncbi:MAG TPA: S-adenosylmethionine:tRNA ribosyltransferase-isomerase, partial [Candidatus Cloacimonadota bacterium]|nr:S-adenosylmethionine:tRNA ribosyltransferase-isomerase [Candidatus Cloacimonadota bacterium]
VYAKELGSIAAPTAGFHFSTNLLNELQDKGIQIAEVILHVGIGTFRPVKTDRIDQHKMHSEFCSVPETTAALFNQAKAESRRVIAVGTTSLRTLESFYQDGGISAGSKWTNIFIYPGKKIHSIDGLITNFHLPKSTLLMLVSAYAGYEFTRRAYQEAIRQNYRFFSYGDAMFIG